MAPPDFRILQLVFYNSLSNIKIFITFVYKKKPFFFFFFVQGANFPAALRFHDFDSFPPPNEFAIICYQKIFRIILKRINKCRGKKRSFANNPWAIQLQATSDFGLQQFFFQWIRFNFFFFFYQFSRMCISFVYTN